MFSFLLKITKAAKKQKNRAPLETLQRYFGTQEKKLNRQKSFLWELRY